MNSEKDQESEPEKENLGWQAEKPQQIPWRGWREILTRTMRSLGKDHISIVAAGAAFFILLGTIPALAAVISIYGLFADPADVQEHFQTLGNAAPAEVQELLSEQMTRIAEDPGAARFGLLGGIILALWSGSRATRALVEALNIAYDETEKRGFFKLYAVNLLLTLIGVLIVVSALLVIAVLPPVIGMLGLGALGAVIVTVLRWVLLVAIGGAGITIFYRYGTSRAYPQWKWVTGGSGVAVVLWLLATAGFSWYLRNFGNYNDTYGSLGALIILLLWLYLTAFVILLGAELNAEMERQTEKDTTAGPPKPHGERGAYVADHSVKDLE